MAVNLRHKFEFFRFSPRINNDWIDKLPLSRLELLRLSSESLESLRELSRESLLRLSNIYSRSRESRCESCRESCLWSDRCLCRRCERREK